MKNTVSNNKDTEITQMYETPSSLLYLTYKKIITPKINNLIRKLVYYIVKSGKDQKVYFVSDIVKLKPLELSPSY